MNKKQQRLNIAKEHAKYKCGECLSTEYINNKLKLIWTCDKGHRWNSSFNNVINNNTWCPKCDSKISKEEFLEVANNIAKSKGGECQSTKYINAKSKLIWKCSNLEHISWEANLDNIKNSNTWCPLCSGRFSKDEGLERAKNIAKSKGGECLSTEYIHKDGKIKWKCNNNHIWEARYHNVVNHGRWCPQCSTYYYKEHIIRYLLEYFLDAKFTKSKPKWNINPKTNKLLELDGYNEKLKIAFEFQGSHHYKTGVFHSEKDDLEYIKYKDETKKQNCLNNNVKLIVIDDKFQLSKQKEITDYILTLFKKLNIQITNKFDENKINTIFSNSTNIQKKYLEEAKQIAILRGF